MNKFFHRIASNAYKAMAWPAILLFSIFFLFPLTQSIWLSLTDWNGFSTPHFIGIENFISFFPINVQLLMCGIHCNMDSLRRSF